MENKNNMFFFMELNLSDELFAGWPVNRLARHSVGRLARKNYGLQNRLNWLTGKLANWSTG
jgi:hypothetical protein